MTSTPIIDIEEEEFIKYQLEQQKQDQHDLKLFYEMKKQEEQKQKQPEQQDKETDELSIDNHILRIKRALNEFVNEVENNSFPFLNRRMK